MFITKELIPNILKQIKTEYGLDYFATPTPVFYTFSQLVEAMKQQYQTNQKKLYIGNIEVDNTYLNRMYATFLTSYMKSIHSIINNNSNLEFNSVHTLYSVDQTTIKENTFSIFNEIRCIDSITYDNISASTFQLHFVMQNFEGMNPGNKYLSGLTFTGYEISI